MLKAQMAEHKKTHTERTLSERSSISPSLASILKRKTKLSLPERREKALKHIFEFYNKQRTLAHPRKTFEEVAGEMNTMSIGYFFKFAKDFEIPLEQKVRNISETI